MTRTEYLRRRPRAALLQCSDLWRGFKHHPSRKDLLPDLLERLEPLPVEVMRALLRSRLIPGLVTAACLNEHP